jgi:hypothetical protein
MPAKRSPHSSGIKSALADGLAIFVLVPCENNSNDGVGHHALLMTIEPPLSDIDL